jgi:hypothetical protein
MTEEQATERDEQEPKQQEQKQEQQERDDDQDRGEAQGDAEDKGGGEGGEKSADDIEEEVQAAKEEVRELEEDPPAKLEDWPQGKAKYETFGGPEGEHGYHEGAEEKLGPSALRHREDGSVEVEGEEVDDPEDYKGPPIPGGPTDPDTPNLRMDKASPDDVSDTAQEAQSEDDDADGDGDGGEGSPGGDESGDEESGDGESSSDGSPSSEEDEGQG